MRTRILSVEYDKVRMQQREIFKTAKNMTINMDGYTEANKKSVLGVNFVTDERRVIVVGVHESNESHTGEHMMGEWLDLLHYFLAVQRHDHSSCALT